MAKFFLDKGGFKYEVRLAEDSREEIGKFGIKQTPTLVILDGEKTDKIVNVSNIRKFTEAGA